MKIAPNLQFAVIEPTKKSLEAFVRMIRSVHQNFTTAFNGNIGFGDGTNLDNINGSWINVVAPVAPDTDFTVNHNLGRIPSGYWIMQKDRACDIYTGSIAATATQLTLRANVASAVLRIFVICILINLGFFAKRSEAQGVHHQEIALKATTAAGSSGLSGSVMQPIPSAIITVCNGSVLPITGSTCTGLASIFSDAALSLALSNPFNADLNGNYGFWINPGSYIISVGGANITTYSYAITLACGVSSTCTYSGPMVFNGSLAVSGAATVTNPCTMGGFIYVSTGGCYTTIPAAIAAFSGGNCGMIYVPVGTQTTNITINSSNACSSSASQMIIQGSGRRSTILKPASNAAVITLDSTAAGIQGVVLRDIGFDNTATGFSQPAILVQGGNINDWHEFHRLRMTGGFRNSINVTGRMVWCVFDEISLEADADIALNIVEGTAPFNFNKFHAVAIQGANGTWGAQLSCTGTCGGQSLLIKNAFDMLDIEAGNPGGGILLNNTEATSIKNAYLETNAGIQISATGTYARALSITDSYLNTSNNTVDISVTATQVSGEISGNLIANSGAGAATISIAGGSGNGFFIHGNYEPNSGPHTNTADGNGTFHASYYGAYAPTVVTTTGSQTPTVTGLNNLRYTNASPATITNFVGGDPGQTLTVWDEGASTVTFTHGNTTLFMPYGNSVTISAGGFCQFFYEPANTRWVGNNCVTGTATGAGVVFDNSTQTLTNKTLNTPLSNGTGHQAFNTATTCTTAATINTPCTTAAITLPVGYSDTNYRLVCSGLTRTNFPQIIDYAKSNTTFTITLNNLTAAAATYGSFDCIVAHN